MSLTVESDASRVGALAVLATGSGVAVVLGAYAGLHEPAGRPLLTFGFSGMLQMKAWFTTAAAALLVVQLVTALWMWGRLPTSNPAPDWTAPLHRWSGASAFVLTLPPALHCLWALGFAADSPRVLLHSVVGCLFYGAYAAKMLGLRLRGLPGWAVPLLGGLVLTLLTLIWLTSALWFFSRSGLPLT
ncbi:DUF6529 family protein [Nocardioides coralli]|uniref:DUF6529 family protein n=1 Tax=Nocardioides coralli TaxID=2872154 RepID=UPI001CA3BFE3|nr:DUF6529 family protein [Nocardioides coralli]QZY29504.1 DUF6529 family protein [Nocardioides coralli]